MGHLFRMQGIWALEGQLPQHKYLQLRVGEKVDRIRISTPQQILKISILCILLFLSEEVIVTQISISLLNKFIILKNVALKIFMGLKVDSLSMPITG